MTVLTRCLLAGALSVLATGSLLYALQHRGLREARDLRHQNERLRSKAVALYQSRQASAAPAPATADGPAPGSSYPRPAADAGTDSEPDYRNEGMDTPAASLQTFAWACDRGDVETVAGMIAYEPAARAKAEALLAAMPEKVRAQWAGLDTMAATLLTRSYMSSPFPGARILRQATAEQVSETRIRMRLPNTPRDRTEFQKEGQAWKYLITEGAVDAYVASQQRGH